MNILFGRSRPSKAPDAEIRPEFAQLMLDHEIEFNFSPSLSSLQSLTSIYTEAIEFYESHKNPKFLHYKSKLQDLLSHPSVHSLLYSQDSPRSSKRVPNLKHDRTCQKTLKAHQVESTSLSKQIKDNIRTQAENLASRLEERKKNRVPSVQKTNEPRDVDKSAGLSAVETFEAEVEEIMERYAESKALAKKQVEEEYKEYLIELSSNDDPIMQQVLKQMKNNMSEEIEARLGELDEKRGKEIALARKKLLSLC